MLRGVPRALAAAVLAGWAGAAPAQEEAEPECGTKPITIARMPWPSAAILANVHAQILETEFGCEVRLVTGDMAAAISSMAAGGQPAVAPEMWAARIAPIWNSAVASGTVRQVGASYRGGGLEGWFVPAATIKANPDLRGLRDLGAHIDLFVHEGGRPRFVSCPPDWACALINRNLIAALGLTGKIDVVEPANRFELDTLIGEAMSRRQAILFYYWQPNAVLAQFSFEALDMGPFEAEAMACLGKRGCPAPAVSAFAPEPVIIALAEWVLTGTPRIAGYFQRASMPLDEMNALLAWQSEQGAGMKETAQRFVEGRQEVWKSWVLKE